MLIEKEVIGPGTIVAPDLKTGQLRKTVVTAAHLQHWHDQGNKMIAAGLTVPVPKEHDFQAHPMTPAEKLDANTGWVKAYKMKDGRLYSILDIQDDEYAKKLPTTIRWTSPWFSSFTDGKGTKWDNVISHLALTTRPRIIDQKPFPSISAAMEFAASTEVQPLDSAVDGGYTLSKAGLLKTEGEKLTPVNSIAFSLYTGVALSEEDIEDEEVVPKKGEPKKDDKQEPDKNPFADSTDDMELDQVLCDLLCILGVSMPAKVSGTEFKKTLYMAAMQKIKELSSKPPAPAPGVPPAPGKKPPHNPIVQEAQPMYMSLEDINKIPDETMRNIALSMYNENVKMQARLDASEKGTASLRDSKLAEEAAKRKMRIDRLSRMSPKVKVDLEAMLALPSMALSMGDAGAVLDPMGQTLSVLEKGLGDLPRLLTTETTPTELAHPTDGAMSIEEEDRLADSQARMMGCPPEKKES